MRRQPTSGANDTINFCPTTFKNGEKKRTNIKMLKFQFFNFALFDLVTP